MAVALPTQTTPRFQAVHPPVGAACGMIGGASSTDLDSRGAGTSGGFGCDSLPVVKSPVAMPAM